jgi:hypothetical protein
MDTERPQNRPLRRMAQQLDLDGRLHDLASDTERMPLFAPVPTQIEGQTYIDTDHAEPPSP